MRSGFIFGVIVGAFVCLQPQDSQAQFLSVNLDDEPIQYSKTRANNRVSKLVQDFAKGDTTWEHQDRKDYLNRLLKELSIPVSSQVLVFSQTSMQVQHISPRNPRAIYFNDDT
ncbi:MAG: hypothetical protein KDB22_29320, partial [Planctomycetales bacterium]|nr:hypothetical protein [Planctomycetales bacterium]